MPDATELGNEDLWEPDLQVVWFPSLNYYTHGHSLNRKEFASMTGGLEVLLVKRIINVVLPLIYCIILLMTDSLGEASRIRK